MKEGDSMSQKLTAIVARNLIAQYSNEKNLKQKVAKKIEGEAMQGGDTVYIREMKRKTALVLIKELEELGYRVTRSTDCTCSKSVAFWIHWS